MSDATTVAQVPTKVPTQLPTNDALKAAVRRVEHDYTKLAIMIKRIESAIETKGTVLVSPLSAAEWAICDQLFDSLKTTVEDLGLISAWLDEREVA